jgi:hypothetical protein
METHLIRRSELGNRKSLDWGAIRTLLERYWSAIGALLERYWSAIGALLERFGALWSTIGHRRYIKSVGIPQKSTGGTISCGTHSIENYILSIQPRP